MAQLDFFSALFEQGPTAAMVVDREFRCVAANRAYLQLTGRTADELLGRNVFEVFPNASATAATVKASFRRVLANRAVDEITAIATQRREDSKDDSVWSARHAPILGEDGEVAFIIQETVEVTALRVARPADFLEATVVDRALRLQASATHLDLELRDLREMFAQAPGFMCFLRGPEHVFEIVNDAYLQLVGHRNVIGMRVCDAVPEISAQGFIHMLDNVFRTGEALSGDDIRLELQRSREPVLEGSYVDFVCQPIRGRTGDVIGIFVQGQDVTARHLAEEERRLSERRRRFLIEAMPNQVWTAGADGKLDFVSDRVAAYFQRSADEILGDGWVAVLHPDDVDTVVARWTRALATGEAYEVEFRLRRNDGEYRWHLSRANAERAADGTIKTWVGTNTDIHDAKLALAELTMRSQYEQRLIGIVSHDLRNPFNVISLATTILASGSLDPVARKLVERVSRAAERATRLVNDLLDFAKARIGTTIPVNPTPTNLKDIVETVVEEFEVAAPGRVIRVGHAGDETGLWDADRLAQVISNLVGNALQHGAPDTPICVASQITDAHALLTVANEGPGIPADEIAELFEPYRRSSTAVATRGSMGLGLYIAREVIAAHGGTIEVESAPNATTRFTVRLPRFSKVPSLV